MYRTLLNYAVGRYNTALLVTRQTLALERAAEHVLQRLAPFLNQEHQGSQWPGTQLLSGETATLHYYNLSEPCAKILQEAVDRLYGWQQPERPEDLCLLRADGSPWLVSIAHEHDGYLELTPEERDELLRAIPLLDLIQ